MIGGCRFIPLPHVTLRTATTHPPMLAATRTAGWALGRVRQLASVLRGLHAQASRDPSFKQLDQRDVAFFKQTLGEQGVVTDPHALQAFNRCGAASSTWPRWRVVDTVVQQGLSPSSFPSWKRGRAVERPGDADDADRQHLGIGKGLADSGCSLMLLGSCRDWMRKYEGRSGVALKPRTTEQVAAVLAYCNAQRLAVVPQGGNTGLVGGSVPAFDEVVLSTSAMNKVVSFDQVRSKGVTCILALQRSCICSVEQRCTRLCCTSHRAKALSWIITSARLRMAACNGAAPGAAQRQQHPAPPARSALPVAATAGGVARAAARWCASPAACCRPWTSWWGGRAGPCRWTSGRRAAAKWEATCQPTQVRQWFSSVLLIANRGLWKPSLLRWSDLTEGEKGKGLVRTQNPCQ